MLPVSPCRPSTTNSAPESPAHTRRGATRGTARDAWYSARTTVTDFFTSVEPAGLVTVTATSYAPAWSGASHVALAGFGASAVIAPPVTLQAYVSGWGGVLGSVAVTP